MGIFLRPAATVVATTALLLSTGIAAHAQSETIKDKSSDVIEYADAADETGVVLNYADSVASGLDMRSLRVKHSKKSVSVTLKFAQLNSSTIAYLVFRTDGKKNASRTMFTMDRKSGLVMNPRGDKRCLAPLTTRLGKGGSIKAVIDRSCLGTPKKIKVSAAASDDRFYEDDSPYFADSYFSATSTRADSWTKWLKAS